ncbi:MAG: hypothetical protein LBQ50_02030 [Planctomycetaceae bacterium]|jgi:regulator of replication initiation timing|nr:hypothetical protein [Planctomycetaceae bacterium]
MSKIVEKITVIEDQIALLQSKIVPLTSKTNTLSRKLNSFSGLLTEMIEETNAICHEIDSAQQELVSIQTILAETKTEGEQISADQDENKRLYESMTEMFGEAFQVVSRFFETAQRIGIVDKEQAPNFLALRQQIAQTKPVVEELVTEKTPESVAEMAEPIVLPVAEEWVTEETPESVAEMAEPIVPTEMEEPVTSPVAEKLITEETPNPFDETNELFDENRLTETELEPNLESVAEISKLTIPHLPDVALLPDLLPPVNEVENTENVETLEETPVEAATLNLPPLQLTTPTVEQTETSEDEEKRLEDLLTNLSTPIST